MSRKLKLYELKPNQAIPFVQRTKEYGNAEFEICPVFRRGILTDVWIYPAQQPHAKKFFHLAVNYKPSSFSVSAWIQKGLLDPRIWIMFWCKEHKCMSFRVYPPNGATNFEVHANSNLSINFDGVRP